MEFNQVDTSASTSSEMVLGSILSLHQHLLNSNTTSTDNENLINNNITSKSLNDSERGQFIPVFELVLGTITYLVSIYYFLKLITIKEKIFSFMKFVVFCLKFS